MEGYKILSLKMNQLQRKDTADIVVAVAKLLDIEIDKKDISITHSLAENKRSNQPLAIIARFYRGARQRCFWLLAFIRRPEGG